MPTDGVVETAVLRGFPALALIDAVSQWKIDLVVMATHGRGGMKRILLGSTAERLIRAGVPALLIRPAAEMQPPVAAQPLVGTIG